MQSDFSNLVADLHSDSDVHKLFKTLVIKNVMDFLKRLLTLKASFKIF